MNVKIWVGKMKECLTLNTRKEMKQFKKPKQKKKTILPYPVLTLQNIDDVFDKFTANMFFRNMERFAQHK